MGVEESRESNFETITAIHVRLMVTQTRLIAVERAGSQIEDGVGGPPPHTQSLQIFPHQGLQTIGAVRLSSAHEQ